MATLTRDVLFRPMLGIITASELDELAHKRIAVTGCGATGFTCAESLVRTGIGALHISDRAAFGADNVTDQFGATVHTIGLPKTAVLQQRLVSINPTLKCHVFDAIDHDNIDAFLAGVDVVCDTIDFYAMETKRLIHTAARARRIPVVLSCPIAFGVTCHLFRYDDGGIAFDDFFDIRDDQAEDEQVEHFHAGLCPSQLYKTYTESPDIDFRKRSAASLSATCLMATAYGSLMTLTTLLGLSFGLKSVPYVYEFDVRAGQFREIHLPGGVRELLRHAREAVPGVRSNPRLGAAFVPLATT